MIQPPWTTYQIEVEPTTMNSPTVPAVAIIERDLDGKWLRQHTINLEQAMRLALALVGAATEAVTPGRLSLGSRSQ